MAIQMHLCAAVALLASSSFFTVSTSGLAQPVEVPKPSFAFSWLDDLNTFEAGGIATIKIKVLGDFDSRGNGSLDERAFNPTLTINGKMGNSSYISGVSSNLEGDSSNWRISFTPIMAGVFNVIISDKHFGILDSSLHFEVLAGHIYPSVCVASWMSPINEFVAGTRVTVLILPRDAFGNNISSSSDDPNSSTFIVSASNATGSVANLLNITNMGWNKFRYISIELNVATAGSLLLHVEGENQTLNGSPLPFKVNPGPLDVSNCVATWNFGTNVLQIFSEVEIFIHQQDQYGNLVSGLYAFDAQVVEKETNLSIPVADLHFEEVSPGIQLFSFSVLEPGNFILTIFDTKQNKSISNMPYDYTVFVGYCDGLKSVINGSGLDNSVAGEMSHFTIYLNDIYQYPSPVDLEWLQVQIVRVIDSYHLLPIIYPMQIVNGSRLNGTLSYDATSHLEISPAPSVELNDTSVGNSIVQASAFDVIYTPEKSGIHELRLFCGNIQLNDGHSFTKEVRAGEVNMTLSGVVKYAPKVPKLIKNEIVVKLLDSFSNPIMLQQSRLKLEIGSINSSGLSWMFVDNNDGSYVAHYLAKDVGTYELCASFDGNHFLPCPFGVNVYSSEYFPKAYDDVVSVWEDQSIAFDALENDYFAGDSANITDSSEPDHGSLLKYGGLFRYTPYKGFFGNDSFNYTISDVNGNLATGAVHISVLSIPPQFVSFPSQLQAIEDMISPRFGGFPGFEITYSDMMENISVNLSAEYGTIFLSPMLMQFWQPLSSGLSVNRGDGEAGDLILEGHAEVINIALQSIKYLGNENFCGDDAIQVSTMNRNGINYLNVPVFVEPINDPPFIHVPEFIILKNSKEDGSLIFDREQDKFEFFIGDPDLLYVPGGESLFVVMFSVEVNSGSLVVNLPAELINTTELKLKNSYQWQTLQTFVTISKHFMVKAKGIRFRGTVNDCNYVMQQLIYQGGEHGAVLTVTLNDMGNYGGCPDSAEKISMPLFTEASVNLIRRSPMSSLVAHTLGSAIVVEFVVVFFLGVLLLFFTCRCAIVLINERRSCDIKNIRLSKVSSLHKPTPNTDLSADATYFTGCCPSRLLLTGQPSNFHQRSHHYSGHGDSGDSAQDTFGASQSYSDRYQRTPPPSSMPLAIEKGKSLTV
ncbi:hypothetical protein PVL29_005479 [Vitis rotundifolia]|uniref:GEX2 N-terminal Ig-like domain-containing protein n=1 Tax=Vitis rotundifolia TaxID=103349 RepID=A0AA39A296_VITRO|nr:hypothetical protein PVL29_005479 [Vitis rotundifolia]